MYNNLLPCSFNSDKYVVWGKHYYSLFKMEGHSCNQNWTDMFFFIISKSFIYLSTNLHSMTGCYWIMGSNYIFLNGFFFCKNIYIWERERKKKNELFFLSLIAGKYFFFLTFHSVSLAFMPSCVHWNRIFILLNVICCGWKVTIKALYM